MIETQTYLTPEVSNLVEIASSAADQFAEIVKELETEIRNLNHDLF